jgi:altronate hydrolase
MRTIPVTLQLNPADNVAVAMHDLSAGEPVGIGQITAQQPIPRGHKVAIAEVAPGERVLKYGQVIGLATVAIHPGEHVHTQNLEFRQLERDYDFGVDAKATDYVAEPATFLGYRRADGRVGTRNYIAIIPSVNCSATVSKLIVSRCADLTDGALDGVIALTHTGGCGSAGPGNYGFELFRRTLAGYAAHPNIGGVLVIGLGCEVNQVDGLLEQFSLPADTLLASMTIQDLGGTRKTIAEGEERVREMAAKLQGLQRQPAPASGLVLGMECGGSDGYSGITANPALGAAADLLIRHGGTAVFGETPEIYGAEQLLTRRAVSKEVGAKLIDRIHWWEEHVQRDGSSIDNNPSPGNKAGGLTTILEKSLGAVAKGGSSNLVAVAEYAEPLVAKGLIFMDTPGYDPVNATGLVAGGANVMCFTTGRGSVFGCKPTPSLKLATNSEVYEHMTEDMDVNCGLIADGERTVEEMGREIFEVVVATASGKATKSEELGFGDEEFAPWLVSTTL